MKISLETKVDLYYEDDKIKGYNMVKNNDMLQYHYFSQEYKNIKVASFIAIFKIKHNSIWYEVGFASLQTSDLNKIFRNLMFGSNLYKNINVLKRERNEYINTFMFLTITRVVLLPNFRGMGLIKWFLDETANQIFKIEKYDVKMIETYSNLLSTYNFHSNSFLNDIVELYKNSDATFVKGVEISRTFNNSDHKFKNKKLSLGVFNVHSSLYSLLDDYYKRFYNVDVNTLDLFKKKPDFNLIESPDEYLLEYLNSKEKTKNITPIFLKTRGVCL